ncbi:hypothetical protein KBC04_02575 [Candidatus Babeliales bacterium]|nr:hypothetical protein [Candidatus Babeliales bacterium]MBP9844063.1 hypothetical protein [Candidatus Babeliales bacterium]
MALISTPSMLSKQAQDLSDENHHHEKLFTFPFAEYDVLELQAIFIQTGIHVIKTKNIFDGRKIVTTILKSLNYYHNIACITEQVEVPSLAYDVMGHINMQKYRKDNLLIDLEDFFVMHPCFDFIWIELSETIENKYKLQDLKEIFNMFHVEERMPVLIVQYENKL